MRDSDYNPETYDPNTFDTNEEGLYDMGNVAETIKENRPTNNSNWTPQFADAILRKIGWRGGRRPHRGG